MYKLACIFRNITLLACLFFVFLSRLAIAAEPYTLPISSGWLSNFDHPSVALQLQLTGEQDRSLKTADAVLQVELQHNWKTYWRAPGDGGAAPQFDFSSSTNIRDVAWAWPAPTRYNILGVDTLGYKDSVTFPLTVYLQDPSKPARLSGTLTIASCTNICVLSDYQIDLPFVSADLTANDEAVFIYQQALREVPVKVSGQTNSNPPAISVLRSSWDDQNQQLTLEIENQASWQSPDIFIDSAASPFTGVTFAAPQMSFEANKLTAQIAVSSWGEKIDLNLHPLTITVVDHDLAVELQTTPGAPESESSSQTLLSMFFIALLGGLILNIMPCVLPVLGMKLSTILVAQGIDRSQLRKQFLASSAGIICSFWLLAAFLFALKFSGQALGWGIQFQSPYFIALMVIITALFAANMLDIFTIQLPVRMQTWLARAGAQSYLGHFFQGIFATLLATPCSAPFLGTAVAFSLAASALQLFIIFSALGLGMALPWLLIAAFPVIASYLPKPGHWMNVMKIVFALMILITSYWLLSLLSRFIGDTETLVLGLGLTALLLFSVAKKHGKKLFLVLLSCLILVVATGSGINYLSARQDNKNGVAQLQWQPLDRLAIARQVQQGKVVFVDITADWCVTCKANKIGVLLQEPVFTLLQTQGIVAMQGDWTVASDRVIEYLQFYGRAAVPFNMVYGPGAPQGLPLPTILTADSVLAAIAQAKG